MAPAVDPYKLAGGPTPPLVHFQVTNGGYRGYPYITRICRVCSKKYLYKYQQVLQGSHACFRLIKPMNIIVVNIISHSELRVMLANLSFGGPSL